MAAKKLKTLYLAFIETHGEAQGIFDQKGKLLDFWGCNDATYRIEYFAPFMEMLGFDLQEASEELNEKLREACEEAWGG